MAKHGRVKQVFCISVNELGAWEAAIACLGRWNGIRGLGWIAAPPSAAATEPALLPGTCTAPPPRGRTARPPYLHDGRRDQLQLPRTPLSLSHLTRRRMQKSPYVARDNPIVDGHHTQRAIDINTTCARTAAFLVSKTCNVPCCQLPRRKLQRLGQH